MRSEAEIRRVLRSKGLARARHAQAEREDLDAIAAALAEGRTKGLEIKEMATLAGISRQTAYSLIEKSPR